MEGLIFPIIMLTVTLVGGGIFLLVLKHRKSKHQKQPLFPLLLSYLPQIMSRLGFLSEKEGLTVLHYLDCCELLDIPGVKDSLDWTRGTAGAGDGREQAFLSRG